MKLIYCDNEKFVLPYSYENIEQISRNFRDLHAVMIIRNEIIDFPQIIPPEKVTPKH